MGGSYSDSSVHVYGNFQLADPANRAEKWRVGFRLRVSGPAGGTTAEVGAAFSELVDCAGAQLRQEGLAPHGQVLQELF